MKGSIRQLVWRIPERAYHKALRAEAEIVEGSVNDLLWDLAIYRHAMQRVVDALWDLDWIGFQIVLKPIECSTMF